MKQSKNHHVLNGAEDGGAGTRGQENYQILQFQRGEERGERGDVPSCRLDGLELVFHYLSSA